MQCVEFLDTLMMEAVNKAGNSTVRYPERDSLFFSTSSSLEIVKGVGGLTMPHLVPCAEFQGSEEQMNRVSKDVASLVKKHGGRDWSFAVSLEPATLYFYSF